MNAHGGRPLTARRRARRLAVQALYQWILSDNDPREIAVQLREDADSRVDWDYFNQLFPAIPDLRKELEQLLEPVMDDRSLDPVEQAVVWLGAFELCQQAGCPLSSRHQRICRTRQGFRRHRRLQVRQCRARQAGATAARRRRPCRLNMSLTERDIIRRYFDVPELALPRPEIKLGCGDDAAILDIPHDKQLLVSADVLVAGVHFPEHAGADLIASRALAVNLSDLAAMAGRTALFLIEPDPPAGRCRLACGVQPRPCARGRGIPLSPDRR